jgi:O-acetylserine/cysteine efflux transporter
MFAFQFSFLFIGMKVGITPGLASLLLQIQVFFTIALAMILFKEKLHIIQGVGALLAAAGVAVVWHHSRGEISLAGFAFVIGAALFWSIGNAISKTINKNEIIPLVIWGSFVAWPPLLAVALFLDGPSVVIHSISHIHFASLCAISYIGYLSTLFGYIVWNWLLHQHPLATIAPYTLLVPIVALLTSTLYFGESFPLWKFGAAALVLSGLVINTLGSRFLSKKNPS